MPSRETVLRDLMKSLGVTAPYEEFEAGIRVEIEHTERGPHNGKYAVVPFRLEPIAKIAAAHLAEIPDYYTRLLAMEAQGKKTAANKPLNTVLDLLGLKSVHKVLDWFDSESEPKQKPREKTPDELIDDDFFASSEAESEEAIYPDDIVRKPGQPGISPCASSDPSVTQLRKLQDQINLTLHYIKNRILPDMKGNPEKFNSLRELRDSLENSGLTLEETIEKLK